MAPSRTSTVKSKHATNKSGIKNSKTSTRSKSDGVSKPKSAKSKRTQSKGVSLGSVTGKGSALNKLKKKRRVYTEKELDIPALNMITPVGVEKPKGGKKGKVFVDDRESMLTILAMVHADKEGQIESKMMKARQMEAIRDARKAEAEKRVEERKDRLDEAKEGLRKKRKRAAAEREEKAGGGVKAEAVAGTRPLRKRKSVSFA
ncbi:putative 60S ribosomal subunit assembly/export protein LOC1 [Amylocarpus encephaloides]|uniref:60S ribosomal subunit assembly/export protein LOC1 n=1 Tax=Amylocarpus encephaloides TaxID=45428 RepID=A0A9P8C3G3_9HELO|nr:putative 60S ribosomal subunit assembly/export protein LOC1 [Amylocarpus encephaloides]